MYYIRSKDRVSEVVGCPNRSWLSWDDEDCSESGSNAHVRLVDQSEARLWELKRMTEPKQRNCVYYIIRPFYPDGIEGTCGTEEYELDALDLNYVYNMGLGTGRLTRWALPGFEETRMYCRSKIPS